MRIGIACGGTGGHMLPGIVVGKALRERGHEVVLWLSGRPAEAWIVEHWGGATECVASAGMPTRASLRVFTAAMAMLRAACTCRKLMSRSRPDALLAMGGYGSVGPVLAARRLRVPVVLHEANAVPGRATSFLSRFAQVTALSFPEAAAGIRGRTAVTGFPVRPLDLRPFPDHDNAASPTLLVMGGSQGAHALNMLCVQAIAAMQPDKRPRLIHLTGAKDGETVRAAYAASGVEARVIEFLSDMGLAYASADFAVCRAGGASCAELAAAGLPALLVPLPGAPRDHQTANARAAAANGGMLLQNQADLTAASLAALLTAVLHDRPRLANMKARLASGPADAAARIAGLVEDCAPAKTT